MNRRRRSPFQVESLEGKQLLSTLHAAPARPAAHIQPAVQAFSLEGTLRVPVASIQTYVSNLGNHAGSFSMSGRLKSTGQISGLFGAMLDSTDQAMQSGQITLANRRGTVVLTLASDPSDATSYLYTATTGTGAFAAATGSGKISTAGASANGKTLFFQVHPNPA